MFLKTAFSCAFIVMVSVSLFFISLSCDDNVNPTIVNDQDTTDQDTTDQDTITPTDPEWVGNFKVTLKNDIDDEGNVINSSVNIVGAAADGPALSNMSWITVMTDGDCRLVEPHQYYCENPCGMDVCVGENTCKAEPEYMNIGEIIVDGVKTTDNKTTFTLGDHTPYMPIEEMVYPPFEDGAQITFSVAGNSEINPFTITGKGIAPMVLKNDTIVYEDGKEITLKWESSQLKHASIFFEIDISYHGGTKARILGETDDDGSYTISAKILDKLKTYGIAGFPRLIIYRRATFKNKAGNVNLIIESEEMRYLQIPGLISCNGTCPEGMECGADRVCREVKK